MACCDEEVCGSKADSAFRDASAALSQTRSALLIDGYYRWHLAHEE